MKKLYYTFCLFFTLSVPGLATIHQVPSGFLTIQSAIDASSWGDTVLVDTGVYYEHIRLNGQNIVLCSRFLTTGNHAYIASTIIDGSHSGRVMTIDSYEDSTCVVAGFTLRNGNASPETGLQYGGGLFIYDASPVVHHCVIDSCYAPSYGGGLAIYGFGAAPRVHDCTVSNNSAESFGGGVFMGDCSAEAIIYNSVITGNTITCSCNFGGGGGGVNLYHIGKLENCLIYGNSAPNAPQGGGGVHCDWGNLYSSQGIFVTGCTIANNTALNAGGVSYVINGGEFRNCIIWGNTDGSNQVSNYDGNTFLYTCSSPAPIGTGNIGADPLFAQPSLGNFRLLAGSPCINAGYDGYATQMTDIDGNPRIAQTIDIGAYEYASTPVTTVQIGSGSELTEYLPVSTCNDYNYSQQIYLGSEISNGGGGPGYITKLRFYFSGWMYYPQYWDTWSVYLGNTGKTSFDSLTDWVPYSGLTQVFSGTIPTPVDNSWVEITLTVPFYYNGQNIVVAVDENSPGWECTAYWGSFTASQPRGLLYGSWENPDPAQIPESNYWEMYQIPQIQFDFNTSYGVLQGYVYREPLCNEPVSGAVVFSGNYSAISDTNGFYSLALPQGVYFDVTATDSLVSHTISTVYITATDTVMHDFCLPIYFPPPVQLEANITGAPEFNDVHLTWKAPGSVADQWIFWGSGTLAGSLGYGNQQMTFSVAHRWLASDLAPLNGAYLKKIRLYPSEANAIYTLKVWKGVDAATTLVSLPLSNLNINTWNEIVLPAPVLIDVTEELWYGYEVTQNEGFPAALSTGPAIAGRGDMFNGYGYWFSMKNAWNNDYNWMLEAFISEDPTPFAPVYQLIQTSSAPATEGLAFSDIPRPEIRLAETAASDIARSSGNVSPQKSQNPNLLSPPSTPLILTGYNVYRDNILIAGNITDLWYNDTNLVKGAYQYRVSAVYDQGESDRIGPASVQVYTCFPPTAFRINPVTLTTTSALLSWTPSTISPDREWLLEWGYSGFSRGSGTIVHLSQDTVYTLNGLIPGYEYDCYLATHCSASDTSAWVKMKFRTRFFECSVTSLTEQENCGDTVNNGCLMPSPAFEPIQCGDTVCGTVWLSYQTRDSDWYSFTLTATSDITLSSLSEFPYQIGIKSSSCPSSGFLVSTYAWYGGPYQQYVQLNPGTYYLYITPSFNGNIVCDSLNHYWMSLQCSDCLTPNALTVSGLTTSTALLSWNSTASLWDIEWGQAGFSQGSGTLVGGITFNNYLLTDLSQGITYQFYVRADCGDGNYSRWAGPYTFTVPCTPSSLPYYEDFSSSIFFLPPLCWEWRGAGAYNNWVAEGSANAGGSTPELVFHPWANYFSGISRIISPVINTTGRLDLTLTFNQYADANSSGTTMEVATTSDDGMTWNTIWVNQLQGTVGPQPVSINFANSDVGSAGFRFAYVINGNAWDINSWNIDEISLDGYLYTGIAEGYVTQCANGSPLSGVKVYAGSDSTTTDLSGFYQFSNLTIGTYDLIFSRSGFIADTIFGLVVTAGNTTTQNICLQSAGPPETRTVQNTTIASGQTVCYDALQTITVAGSGTTFAVQSGGSATMIAGLKIRYLPGTRVFTGGYMHGKIAPAGPWCGAKSASFTEAGNTGNEPATGSAGLLIFPNPTRSSFTVTLTGDTGTLPVMVEVYDIRGKRVVETSFQDSTSGIVSLDGLSPGLYPVRVVSGDKVFITKVVKH